MTLERCPKRSDETHCEHWQDGGPCCDCKAPADPSVCKTCGAADGHDPACAAQVRPIVIIESPFAGDLERNARYLDACISDSLRRGEAPFASHGLYTRPGVLRDSESAERELGILAGFAFRRVADRTVVYTDLGISDGMRRGIDDANEHGQLVEYRELEGEWTR